LPSNDDEKKEWLVTRTDDLKLVADYTHSSFGELLETDCFTYKFLFRDAFIDKMRQSEAGQEYLENCWILTQTTPDKKALREQFQ